MVTVVSVVGARPQFVKLAPVHKSLITNGFEHRIIHTGQHYDAKLSDVFFQEFGIPEPDISLGIGSHSHATQTARIMIGLEESLIDLNPDWVLAYGDTNSTLACAIACSKLPFRLAHIEAGLRSNNKEMPEEHNRILTDHCSDLLLAPTHAAMEFLREENLGSKSHLVGDVMIDILNLVKSSIEKEGDNLPLSIDPSEEYILATIHRQENTDYKDRLQEIVSSLQNLRLPTFIPSHPRLVKKCEEFGITLAKGNLNPVDPLSYRELITVALSSDHIVTDSGGLQKEAFHLGTPCTTVRTETEWPETLSGEWNRLAEPSKIAESILRQAPNTNRGTPFGNGDAANNISQLLKDI